jgi:hypothetical protein
MWQSVCLVLKGKSAICRTVRNVLRQGLMVGFSESSSSRGAGGALISTKTLNFFKKVYVSLTYNGMVRSDMSKSTDFFFFTARVHTTKSTVKILAANKHCEYFLKIAEVTHFFCTRNRLYQRLVQPFLALTTAVLSLDRCNILLGWVSRMARCILFPALLGVDISPRVWQVTILAMFSNF